MARDATLRQYNGAESTVPSLFSIEAAIHICKGGSVVEVSRNRSILVNKQNNFKKRNAARNSPSFAYSSGYHLFILLYCGRKRKYIKSKTAAKLREKRTSIAAV
jgi:hypothetical protein